MVRAIGFEVCARGVDIVVIVAVILDVALHVSQAVAVVLVFVAILFVDVVFVVGVFVRNYDGL